MIWYPLVRALLHNLIDKVQQCVPEDIWSKKLLENSTFLCCLWTIYRMSNFFFFAIRFPFRVLWPCLHFACSSLCTHFSTMVFFSSFPYFSITITFITILSGSILLCYYTSSAMYFTSLLWSVKSWFSFLSFIFKYLSAAIPT